MEKRFSLENIVSGIERTGRRFPFLMLIALLGTGVGLGLIHNQDSHTPVELLSVLVLAFPLFIGATIYAEQVEEKKERMFGYAMATLVVALYFVYTRGDYAIFESYQDTIQYALWLAAAFLSMTFAPFIKKGMTDSLRFWSYNKSAVYAFIFTGFYSAVLYIGLAVALQSVNFLFDLDIKDKRWGELWIITVGIFSTTFFLSRYPKVKAYESEIEYPKELRLFAYYILAPLISLYFIILYSYTLKIVTTWEWPKGVISYMILGFSTLGILTYVTLFPLILKDKRLEKIGKVFFGALLPQAAVLLFAVWLRISDYGITENRYLLVVFGSWLIGIPLYFLGSTQGASKEDHKKLSVIPVSLCIILIVISFGPWGMFSVSKRSQVSRLTSILEKNQILIDGKITKEEKEVSKDESMEIYEILSYLDRNDNLTSIQPWFLEDISTLSSYEVVELLGIKDYRVGTYKDTFHAQAKEGMYTDGLSVKGYDYLTQARGSGTYEHEQKVADATYQFLLDADTQTYTISKNHVVLGAVPLQDLFTKLSKKYYSESRDGKYFSGDFPREEMSFVFENKAIKAKVYFTSISGKGSAMYTDQIIIFTSK